MTSINFPNTPSQGDTHEHLGITWICTHTAPVPRWAKTGDQAFNNIHLGAFAVAPTLDNNGNTLIAGQTYFNTTDGEVGYYDGAAWDYPAVDTATDVVTTNADVLLTNADVVTTNADVVLTGLDVVTTNADVVLTGLDVVSTNADVVLTNADVVATNADAASTAADVVLTNANAASTAADVVTVLAAAADIDGGIASSVFLPSQVFDGGSA